MEEVKLKYSKENNSEEELQQFFEYQDIIKEDLKRIYYLISDYEESEERNNLLFELNVAISNINQNRFPDDPIMDLDIHIYKNYLVFSYWKLNEDGAILLSNPSIAIITRDMKNFYFIDEKIIQEDETNDYDSIGLDSINCYTREKNKIIYHNVVMRNRTGNLFYNCFDDTDSFVKKMKDNYSNEVV